MESNGNIRIIYYNNLEKELPSNKIIYFVIIMIKILPIFIITHDWNISFNKGISYWIRKLVLCELIKKNIPYDVYPYFIFLMFLSLLFTLIIYRTYHFLVYKKKIFKLYSFIVFYIFYVFNQFLISIFVEVIFNDKKEKYSKSLYYILITLICILTYFMFYSNVFLCSVVINSPIIITNYSFMINPLNEIDYITPLLSLIQAFVQLEFYLEFKTIILLKNIVRGIYILYYIKEMITFDKYYSKFKFEYYKRIFISSCFISCLIEWCFLYDYKNKLIILQKDFGIIFLKLIIELNLSIVLTDIYFHFDRNILEKTIENFSSKNINSLDNNMIKFFNIIYNGDRLHTLKILLLRLNKTLEKSIHHPKCKDSSCYYCYEYSYKEFNFQIGNFIELKSRKNSINSLEKEFPLLYKYLYNEITSFYLGFSSQKMNVIINKIIIIISFFFLFEKNYMKCLYILEKLNSLDNEKKNQYYLDQNKVLINRVVIYHRTKGQEHKKIVLFNSNNENIGKILKAENLIKNSLNSVKNIMNNFNNDIVEFYCFADMIKNFYKEYNILNKKINNLFGNSKCNVPYSKQKFLIYFNYIYGEIPKNLTNSFDTFFSLQNSSLIEIVMKNTYLLLFTVIFSLKDIHLQIKYGSEDLINKLRYNTNEFKNLDINKLFAKTFYKSYKYTIINFLRNGNELLNINNFCILDKDKYVVLFNVEGTSLYTKEGIILFLKLKDAKEQKLIKENNKKNNKKKINFCGSCFLFTNNNGRIVSLSRGFEEYFYLKYEVLKQNNLNVRDIFKLNKLEDKGYYEANLFDIYDNIIDIFTDKIGLIGEDDFSKAILQIKEVKSNLSLSNINFIMNINYEKREMKREEKKIKIYYLFFIDVSTKDNNNFLSINKINFDPTTPKSEKSLVESSVTQKNEIDKFLQTSLKQKILYSNKLSYFVLKKYFNISFDTHKNNIKEDEMSNLLNHKNKRNQNLIEKNSFTKELSIKLNDDFINVNKKNSFKDLRQYLLSQKGKSKFGFFFRIIYSFSCPILFLITFIYKIKNIIEQEDFFKAHVNYEMVGITLNDLLLKVLQMQFQGNNIQPKILENRFNNSFENHRHILSEREYDYNTFYIQFYQFYTSKIISSDVYFYEMYKKKYNFRYPLRSGKKNEILYQMESLHVSILLSPINNLGPIEILYNHSNIYYNNDNVLKSNLSFESFYYGAYSYIGFLRNFLAGYKYYNNEITNYFAVNILDKKIAHQQTISLYIIIIIVFFIAYSFLYFLIFYLETKILFAKYHLVHTLLRFFNNYILKKTIIIYDYVDFSQKNIKIKEILSHLKFENDIEQVTNIKYIFSGQIDEYNLIKVRPLLVKYKGITSKYLDLEKKTILEESKDELSLIFKKSSFLYEQPELSKQNHLNISNSNKGSKKNKTIKLNIKNLDNSKSKEKSKINNKDKNTSNRLIFNSTNRTNITNSTFNSSLNLVNSKQNALFDFNQNNQYNQIGHKLLKKPLLYCTLFLTLVFFGIILLIITLIYYHISCKLVKSFNSIINTFRGVIANIKFICEMFIAFELSILENNPISYKYQTTQYSFSCDALKNLYSDTINTHELFEELSTCFPYFKIKVDELINGGCDKKMKNLIEFQKLIEGKNFCENYSQFLIKNLNDKKISDLKINNYINYEKINNECKLIGDGLNKEGYSNVINGMYTSLNSLYRDFKNNKNRTEEYNLLLLNNPQVIMFQLECYYVLTKIPLCYYIVMNRDLEYIHENALKIEIFLLTFQLLIICIVIIIYLLNTFKFKEEFSSVEFFNKCVLHMIFFEK